MPEVNLYTIINAGKGSPGATALLALAMNELGAEIVRDFLNSVPERGPALFKRYDEYRRKNSGNIVNFVESVLC